MQESISLTPNGKDFLDVGGGHHPETFMASRNGHFCFEDLECREAIPNC